MPIVVVDGEQYYPDTNESPLGSFLFLGACVLTLGFVAWGARKERREEVRHREMMIEILTEKDEQGDPRDWFPALFPPNVKRMPLGGRLWKFYPFRIGGDLFTGFSTSNKFLHVFGENKELYSLPWSEVKNVSVFIERPMM